MSEPVFVSTKYIHPNPYQPRQGEDPEAVAELAASILRDGLMQVPTGRPMPEHPGSYELAFGHSRLAAFRWLASRGADGQPTGFETMPLIVRELTDLQMFELGVAENIKRRNLNPIEQARAMRRYLDDFHKTSEEAAEFFSVSAETVRGSVRLLNLPQEVQANVADGTLTIGAARALLGVQKIAPQAVEDAVAEVKEYLDPDNHSFRVHDSPEEAVASALGQVKTVKEMHNYDTPFLQTEPKKFPHKHLNKVTPQQALRLLGLDTKKVPTAQMKICIDNIEMGAQAGSMGVECLSAEELEKLTVLISPPMCTQCPLHTIISGDHFCGMPMCYERKHRAWKTGELDAVARKTGIPIYDPAKDGDVKVLLRGYEQPEKKLFDAKGEDLRIMPRGNEYSNFAGMDGVATAVVVGKTAEKLIKSAEKKGEPAHTGPGTDAQERERQAELLQRKINDNIERSQAFVVEVAAGHFAKVFEGVKNLPLLWKMVEGLAQAARYDVQIDWTEIKKLMAPKKLACLQGKLAEMVLLDMDVIPDEWREGSPLRKGPTATAKHLQKVATDWGVKLPKDWLETAKEWDTKDIEAEK